jgi:hypothetical protein
MNQLAIAVAIVIVAVVIAVVVERRRPEPPTRAQWQPPAQLDRADFTRPDASWLLVVFSSATCDSCRDTVGKAAILAGDDVAFEEVEVGASADRHERYGIDAVPITVLADADGVVVASFVGPPTAADLWAAVARARDGQSEGPT